MKPTFIDVEEQNAIEKIRDALMCSDGITCNAELYEPELYAEKKTYIIPCMYRVVVDYNKLAAAIYEAGFRKIDTRMDKEYDTLVCAAVKKDPLAFVDILQEEAGIAEKGECKSENLALLLREAACLIANLLLT